MGLIQSIFGFLGRNDDEERAKEMLRQQYIRQDFTVVSLPYMRMHWKRLRINADDCDVLKADGTFDLQAIREEHSNDFSNEGVLGYENVQITRITCYDKTENPHKVYRTTLVDTNADVTNAKLNVQGYIDIYSSPLYPDVYHIDTEFLEKDLTELMSH